MDSQTETTRELYTVGHSNHTLEKFLSLLSSHGIEVLIDTRSSPIPRRMPDAFGAELIAGSAAAERLHRC